MEKKMSYEKAEVTVINTEAMEELTALAGSMANGRLPYPPYGTCRNRR